MFEGIKKVVKNWLMGKSPLVIMYHSVGVDGGVDNISIKEFERHIRWLKKNCSIVGLEEIFERKENKKKVVITFDDGLCSFHKNAIPILRTYSAPATVFVISVVLQENRQVKAKNIIKNRLKTSESLMGYEKLLNLKEDPIVTIGSHSITHPKIPKIDNEKKVVKEVRESKEIIEKKLKIEIDKFAYPHNKYDQRTREIVSNSYSYAVKGGGRASVIDNKTDPYLVPRVSGARSLNEIRAILIDAVRSDNRFLRRWIG
jgi:peptidoglycan/xylan/chitin deacetylase (PgdA/CDA1 family)